MRSTWIYLPACRVWKFLETRKILFGILELEAFELNWKIFGKSLEEETGPAYCYSAARQAKLVRGPPDCSDSTAPYRPRHLPSAIPTRSRCYRTRLCRPAAGHLRCPRAPTQHKLPYPLSTEAKAILPSPPHSLCSQAPQSHHPRALKWRHRLGLPPWATMLRLKDFRSHRATSFLRQDDPDGVGLLRPSPSPADPLTSSSSPTWFSLAPSSTPHQSPLCSEPCRHGGPSTVSLSLSWHPNWLPQLSGLLYPPASPISSPACRDWPVPPSGAMALLPCSK
jgi:hypothetical protein